MSLLWNTMQPEINKTYMFLTTKQEIQEAIKQTYSKVKDATQIYEKKTKIHSTKQGSLSIVENYNLTKGLWFELDYYQNLTMKNSENAAMFLKKESEYLNSWLDLTCNIVKYVFKYLERNHWHL